MHFIKTSLAIISSSWIKQIKNGICIIIFLTYIGLNYSVAETFWVKTSGNDLTGIGSEDKPWATLKHACKSVPANLGHIIRLGEGVFMDADRLNNSVIAATIPENVSLVGEGMDKTTYVGRINSEKARNQIISDFTLDGTENTDNLVGYFQGLSIGTGDNLEIKNIRIKEFYGMGLELARVGGLKNSSLHHCEFINNGMPDKRGFGMRTGNLTDCEIHDNVFIEQRGRGGEPWNSGSKIFTNVKVYNNKFTTHADIKAGWNGQIIFNFEWWRVDCLNVEIFNNEFDGSLSLIDSDITRDNRTPFSVRVYNNRWTYTKRYGIESGLSDLVVDHNYFHFEKTPAPDTGNGYMAVGQFGTKLHNNIKIYHNVIVGVPLYAFSNIIGNSVHIYNNTVIASSPELTPDYLKNSTTSFIQLNKGVQMNNYNIKNNIFICDEARKGKFIAFDSTLPTNLNITSNLIQHSETGITETMLSLGGVENPIVADPKFIATGDSPYPYYKLSTGSPCINAGEMIPGITDGFEGSAPDIGAYSSGILSSSSSNKLNENIRIYPNPIDNVLNIRVTNATNLSEYAINVYDITGKLQKQLGTFNFPSSRVVSIDCSALKSGIYLIESRNSTIRILRKIIKK